MSVNEALLDRAIANALHVARYSKGEADKFVGLLNRADADIVKTIAARIATIEERGYDIGPATTARLREMLAEVRAFNQAIFEQFERELTQELTEFSSTAAAIQQDAIVGAIGVDLGTKLPSPQRLRAIVTEIPIKGRVLSSWAEKLTADRMQAITASISEGMMLGQSTDKIVARVRGTKAAGYSDGVFQGTRVSAQTLVRTSINHVNNVASQETWKVNSHLVKGWQFVATLDSRTSKPCAGLSGQVFPIGEGPIPPRHPNCRSTTVAVTKSFRELGVDRDELPPGTRASMDGQIAGDTKFSDWLTRKGEATQEKILGKTRAELFRTGKLDLQQFVKDDGSVLTLEQLRRKYPSAFR